MRGNITQRGKNSFRLKFDAGRDPATGKRNIQFHTFRGTKRQAQTKLAELIASVDKGGYIEPSKTTVAEFARARVDQWEATNDISARTAQRYRGLVEHQIVPHLGAMMLQKLRPLDIERWHSTLRNSGRMRGKGNLSARTIGHAHKVLGKALADAARNELISRNVARLRPPPKVADTTDEMAIIRDVPALVEKLQGRAVRLPALLGLLCGLRLGEMLGLRWGRVDLDSKVIKVRETLEQTKAHGIRFKPPKSRAGVRDVTMPDEVVEALREYRKSALELRLQLGAGRLPDDALLFADIDGKPRSLYAASQAWRGFAESIGMPGVTYHSLRHAHAAN